MSAPLQDKRRDSPSPLGLMLTESAARQAKNLLADQPENAGKFLRIFAEGGCGSAMEYGLLFDRPQPEDTRMEMHGITLILDPASARHLQGSVIDYTEDTGTAGFRISHNRTRCGCDCNCDQNFEA